MKILDVYAVVLNIIKVIAYPEHMVFFQEHHLLKTFTKCLNEGSKNMSLPLRILKTRGRERPRSMTEVITKVIKKHGKGIA